MVIRVHESVSKQVVFMLILAVRGLTSCGSYSCPRLVIPWTTRDVARGWVSLLVVCLEAPLAVTAADISVITVQPF